MPVKVLGKVLPFWAIASLIIIGIGSATLLNVYVTVQGTANIRQSIQLYSCQAHNDGNSQNNCFFNSNSNSATFSMDAAGGDSRYVDIQVQNIASVPINISLVSSTNINYTVAYYGAGYDSINFNCTGGVLTNSSLITIPDNTMQEFCVGYTWIPTATGTYDMYVNVDTS